MQSTHPPTPHSSQPGWRTSRHRAPFRDTTSHTTTHNVDPRVLRDHGTSRAVISVHGGHHRRGDVGDLHAERRGQGVDTDRVHHIPNVDEALGSL